MADEQVQEGYAQQGHTPKGIDWIGWRSFVLAMLALAIALILALYSSSAAETGRIWLAGISALAALAIAGWVALTIVPVLARRTSLHWFPQIDYRLTREGIVYIGGIFIVALAAINTGNNLLFMVLACLLAGILISGVMSQTVLRGVELRLDLPEHIFAGRPVIALAELINRKRGLPSFSLRLVGNTRHSSRTSMPQTGGAAAANNILSTPVYFPYLRRGQVVQQSVELLFSRRGVYRQESLGLQTRFPFGFLEKTRRTDSCLQAVVYPSVEPTEDFYEILPSMSGELESFLRGRGNDLYAIRDYQRTDTARHVDWKASAKAGALQVREFAREDDRQVLLVLDPALPPAARIVPASLMSQSTPAASPESASAAAIAGFDRGIALCASLAWYFYELDSVLMFRTAGFETPMAAAGENIYDILRYLATAQPISGGGRSLLDDLADSPQIFKIILTSQPQGSIPASLWNSSYILFLNAPAAEVTVNALPG